MIVYTTAPKSYDYGYMEQIGETRTQSQTVRILVTDDEYRAKNYQIPRYQSGLYYAGTTPPFGTIED